MRCIKLELLAAWRLDYLWRRDGLLLVEGSSLSSLNRRDTLIEYLLLLRVLQYLLVHFYAELRLMISLREAARLVVLLQRHELQTLLAESLNLHVGLANVSFTRYSCIKYVLVEFAHFA